MIFWIPFTARSETLRCPDEHRLLSEAIRAA
jgi:hypothetical protein